MTVNIQPFQRVLIDAMSNGRPIRLLPARRGANSRRMDALMREAIRVQRQEQTVEQAIQNLSDR